MPAINKSYDFSLPIRRITQDKNMPCWYASATMVLTYRNVAMSVVNMSSNIDALTRYFNDVEIFSGECYKFASEVGLHSDQSIFIDGFSVKNYSIYLKMYGPLWFGGLFYGLTGERNRGHVVVVCGVAGDKLLIADPDPAKPFPLWETHNEIEAIRNSLNAPILYMANAPFR